MNRVRRVSPRTQSSGLKHLQVTPRFLWVGIGFLVVVLAGGALTSFDRSPGATFDTVKARELVLVDSTGTPRVHITWNVDYLQFAIPASMPGNREEIKRTRGSTEWHRGAKLYLRPGMPGPSLVLTDGNGREMVRLGSPAARPVDR